MSNSAPTAIAIDVAARPTLLLLVLGLATAAAPLDGQEPDPLDAALVASRSTVELRDGRVEGDGGELLLREGRSSQFFLIGEEHGVAEIPLLTSALFRALAPEGYGHLAIETGDGIAQALEARAGAAEPMESLVRFYEDHWPGAPFYTLRTEARLLVDAVAAGGRLWGLDYDVMADRYALDRLLELADSPGERAMVERVKAAADSALERALTERNPGLFMMFGGPASLLAGLRPAFDPQAGTEEDRIITLLEETRAINQHWLDGEVWESNHRRAQWNRGQLGRLWHEARDRTGEAPRVMMKFGASHMLRGRTFTGVFDLGALAAGLAESVGRPSFHLLVVGGAGTSHAAMDPTVMEYRPAPAEVQAQEWATPLFRNADPERWTLFDLRPLRPRAAAGGLGMLPDRLEQVIHGFDAVLVLSGSRPAEMLEIER